MSIFTSMAERDRVFSIIENKEKFEELKTEDMFVISCMYEPLYAIENVITDYSWNEKEAEKNEDILDALNEARLHIMASIAEVYVSIINNDKDYWKGDEE